jgi:dihydroorotase
VDREFLRSKSANTPFLGKRLRGRVAMVVLGGERLLERL